MRTPTGIRDRLVLYAPLLAIIVVQGLLIVSLPSRADLSSSGVSTPALAVDESRSPGDRSGSGGSSVDQGGANATVDGGQPTPDPVDGGDGAAVTAGAACIRPGGAADRVLGIVCHPAFTGDNGGTTHAGVTADAIDVVFFESEENATVNATLAREGLASTAEDRDAAIAAFTEWANSRWELYGRRIEVTRIVGRCPVAPEDHDTCLASAQEVVDRAPFAVIWPTFFYDDVFELWADAGILTFGGQWWSRAHHAERRPYRWDYFSNGDEVVELTAELYCKNLFGGAATHAGVVIHPTIGGRDTPRHLGIVASESPLLLRNGQILRDRVAECTNGADVPTLFAASNDLNRVAETLSAMTSRMINDDVTTLVYMGTPVSTALVSSYLTQERYFPEWLVWPAGYMDADVTGHLADDQQWAHAFGLGQLATSPPRERTPAAQVWTATGREGAPCETCSGIWQYLSMVGVGLQLAGPALDPAAMERAFRAAEDIGPFDAYHSRWRFEPGDHGMLSDFRIVFWSEQATSEYDGDRGAYVQIGGPTTRYWPGELPSDVMQQIPVADV